MQLLRLQQNRTGSYGYDGSAGTYLPLSFHFQHLIVLAQFISRTADIYHQNQVSEFWSLILSSALVLRSFFTTSMSHDANTFNACACGETML